MPSPQTIGLRAFSVIGFLFVGLTGCSPPVVKPVGDDVAQIEAFETGSEISTSLYQASGSLHYLREYPLAFRVGGTLSGLGADRGDRVEAGKRLAWLDDRDSAARLMAATAARDKARADLARFTPLEAKGAISTQSLEDLKTGLKQAEANFGLARYGQDSVEIRAPSDGIILSRSAELQQTVAPGQLVIIVADSTSPMIFRAYVSDHFASRLHKGDAAKVRLSGTTQAISARIRRLGAGLEPGTGTLLVELDMLGAQKLISGQVGSAEFQSAEVQTLPDQLKIPAEALLEIEGSSAYVYAIDKDVAHRRRVEFHGMSGDQAIVSGLKPGVKIATMGAGYINDGSRVHIVRLNGSEPIGGRHDH